LLKASDGIDTDTEENDMSVSARMLSIADFSEPAVYSRAATSLRPHPLLTLVPDCTADFAAGVAPDPRPPISSMATPRLTRRGVVVLWLGGALIGFVMLLIAHVSLASSTVSGDEVPQSGVRTVHSGETLWSIAQEIAPERDPRIVVARLRDLNHLSGVSLRPGQSLAVH
jgi:hypothetical protein